jgi:hypothetical protein
MANYGIKLVWGGYRADLDNVIGFSPSAYERWKYDIQPGTLMLLYETSKNKGVQGIVSVVEVVEGFENTANLGLISPTDEHDHLVKIKVVIDVDSVPVIPREEVQRLLNYPSYPQQNDSWTPISGETYLEFLKLWEQMLGL